MPTPSPIVELDKVLSGLLNERRQHADALAKIDAVFAKYGIDPKQAESARPVSSAKPTSPTPVFSKATSKPAKKRAGTRGKFAVTGVEFVKSLMAGGKNPTSADIATAWKGAGRGGKVDNTLSKLVKDKEIKRTPLKEGRGSSYSLT